jgi:ankyrin repeat protein
MNCFGKGYTASNPRFITLVILLLMTGCGDKLPSPKGSSDGLPVQSAVEILHRHFASSPRLDQSGWSVRDIYEKDEQLYAVLDFPDKSLDGKARLAPTYRQLLALCPVVAVDDYWRHASAKPFSLYLSKVGKSGAIQMTLCTSSFDEAAFARAAGLVPNEDLPPVVLPPENVDPDSISAQLSQGSPSFNQALEAMEDDDNTRLQRYLMQRPELVHFYDSRGTTLLFSASSAAEAIVLVAYGADPNVQLRDGPTVLGWASTYKNRAGVVSRLIDMGANAKYASPELAASKKIAELLLANGAVITENSLNDALANHHVEAAAVLYERGARLETANKYHLEGTTPLHYALKFVPHHSEKVLPYQLEEIEAFIKYTQNVNAPDANGVTPLASVAQQKPWHGQEKILELLRRYGAVDIASDNAETRD